MKIIRHVVMFRWNDSADAAAKRRVLESLAALPDRIPHVRSFRYGVDAGISKGTYDLAVVADFDDKDGYCAYADHPVHVQLVTEVIGPVTSERAAVQHELD
jgi:hypothetical protein